MVIVGVLATSSVRPELKDRLLPPVEGQLFRRRFFKIIVLVKKAGLCPVIEVIGAKKYDEMWDEYLKQRATARNTKLNTELTDAV